jgi:hypothetical protein
MVSKNGILQGQLGRWKFEERIASCVKYRCLEGFVEGAKDACVRGEQLKWYRVAC